jgi:hypothetical protein
MHIYIYIYIHLFISHIYIYIYNQSTTGTEVDGADETVGLKSDSFDLMEDEDEEDLTLAGNQVC